MFLYKQRNKRLQLKNVFFSFDMCFLKFKIMVKKIIQHINKHKTYYFFGFLYFESVFFMLLQRAFCLKLTKNKNTFCWRILIYIICFETISRDLRNIVSQIILLLLSANSKTWKIRTIFSIIDFVFMIDFFCRVLLHCHMRSKINQSLNHISIFMLLIFEINFAIQKKQKFENKSTRTNCCKNWLCLT